MFLEIIWMQEAYIYIRMVKLNSNSIRKTLEDFKNPLIYSVLNCANIRESN